MPQPPARKWANPCPGWRFCNSGARVGAKSCLGGIGPDLSDNPVNEALNGWIKEELYAEFNIERCWRIADFKQTIERYVKYYNTQRPCFAIGYDTPENYRKRYYKGELPRKQTFENRVLSPEPKFVQKRRQLADSKDTYEGVSTFEKEIPEKS